MARKTRNGGKKAILDGLRVQLIPVDDISLRGRDWKLAVQHLVSLMVADLHRRGRPKSADGEKVYEFNRAWAKARPLMRKRLLAGVFSSMTLDASNLNLYYRLDGAEMSRVREAQKEKASELGSGASPFGRSANRYNQFFHSSLLPWSALIEQGDKASLIPRVV